MGHKMSTFSHPFSLKGNVFNKTFIMYSMRVYLKKQLVIVLLFLFCFFTVWMECLHPTSSLFCSSSPGMELQTQTKTVMPNSLLLLDFPNHPDPTPLCKEHHSK